MGARSRWPHPAALALEGVRGARRKLASCRACLWNCHAEMNLVLPQWGAATPAPSGFPAPLPARVRAGASVGA
jgi:hypothetical protein